MNARRRCVSPLPAKCRHEPAPRGAARLSVRASGAPEGRHRPAAGLAAHRDVDRRAAAPTAAVRPRGAAPQRGRTRQLPGHRRPAATAPGVRRLADAPLRAAGRQRRPATRWCCRSTARAKRCSRSCRRSSTAAGAPLVLMPNPFYQIYEGAALLAGAQPLLPRHVRRHRLSAGSGGGARRASGGAARCCSCAVPATRPARCCRSDTCSRRSSWPSATTSSIASRRVLRRDLSRRGRPAAGAARGRAGARARSAFERCVVFHSLSKRSSVPGLRSGFVAGDAATPRAVPALSHLSRQRHAGADAARQHRGLGRRRARGREPRAVPGEIRARAADPRRRAGRAAARRRASICGRRRGRR